MLLTPAQAAPGILQAARPAAWPDTSRSGALAWPATPHPARLVRIAQRARHQPTDSVSPAQKPRRIQSMPLPGNRTGLTLVTGRAFRAFSCRAALVYRVAPARVRMANIEPFVGLMLTVPALRVRTCQQTGFLSAMDSKATRKAAKCPAARAISCKAQSVWRATLLHVRSANIVQRAPLRRTANACLARKARLNRATHPAESPTTPTPATGRASKVTSPPAQPALHAAPPRAWLASIARYALPQQTANASHAQTSQQTACILLRGIRATPQAAKRAAYRATSRWDRRAWRATPRRAPSGSTAPPAPRRRPGRACRAPRRRPTRSTPRPASRTAPTRATGTATLDTFSRGRRARPAAHRHARTANIERCAALLRIVSAHRAIIFQRTASMSVPAIWETPGVARQAAPQDISRSDRAVWRATPPRATSASIGQPAPRPPMASACPAPRRQQTPGTRRPASRMVRTPAIGCAIPDISRTVGRARRAARLHAQ